MHRSPALRRPSSSYPAAPPSTRRRRIAPERLDPVTVAALREMLAPPPETEADGERAVADIMARIHAATGLLAGAAPAAARR